MKPLTKKRWTTETFTINRTPQVVFGGDIGGISFSKLTSGDTAV